MPDGAAGPAWQRNLLLVCAYCGVYWIVLYFHPVQGDALAYIDGILEFVASVVALFMCWGTPKHLWMQATERRHRTVQSPFRQASTWFGIGFLDQIAGNIVTLATGLAFPSVADVFFLATYPCMLVGILLLPMRPLPTMSRLRVSVDGLLIMTGLVTVCWYFVLAPTMLRTDSSLWSKVIGTGYPIGDLLLGACLLLLWLPAGTRTLRSAAILISAGALLAGVTDIIYDYQQLHGSYAAGALIDPAWALAYLLVGVGVAAMRSSQADADRVERAPHVPMLGIWRSLAPYAPVPVIGVLLVHMMLRPSDQVIEAGVSAGAFAVTGLILLRQYLAMRELQLLYSHNSALSDANTREQARAEAAEELVRLRGDFVASVSHELRTPLTGILGYAELLQARWDTISGDARRNYVRRIVWSANRQLRLVQDLLLVSRLDGEALSLECMPTELAGPIQLAAAELLGNYPEQQLQMTGPSGVQVQGDAVRLTQILVNLLDNAAKYSPEGSLITMSWALSGAEVRIRVNDRGPGIPAEGRQRLFTRFGRLAGSPIRAGRVGTGLGLFLGRQLARAMAGDLELEATGPEGSTFCLRLPCAAMHHVGSLRRSEVS